MKRLDVATVAVENMETRREEFQLDWARNLQYLLPPTDDTTFEMAWDQALELVKQID